MGATAVAEPEVVEENVSDAMQQRLFEVGGAAPNIVSIGVKGRVENAPTLEKGKQYTFILTGTCNELGFVDKKDADDNVEKTTRRQVVTIDSLRLQ